ncbi:hypothetical protein BC831DRAFT_481980 [Entophlyctis helioformis]|nr:hypothetical protein BC831DRAFT_481980 [Entophlyctis helioformis]
MIFEEVESMRVSKPRFDCAEEYIAAALSLLAALCSLWAIQHFTMRIRRAAKSRFAVLMLLVSITCSVMQIANLLQTHFVFVLACKAVFGISMALTSILFALAQTEAIHIFLSHTGATVRVITMVRVAHLAAHFALATPLYFSGTLLGTEHENPFISAWYMDTVPLWWAWLTVTDFAQNMVIWVTIGRLGRDIIEIKERKTDDTDKTTSGSIVVSEQYAPDAHNDRIAATPSAASPDKLLAPARVSSSFLQKRRKAKASATLMQVHQAKFRRMFAFLGLFVAFDLSGVLLFVVSLQLLDDDPGSLSMRRSSAYAQMGTANLSFHTVTATVFYVLLTDLFNLSSRAVPDLASTPAAGQGAKQ